MQPAAEAVLTIGWGGVGRLDLEPAGCDDPQCEADHGYTGVLAADDFSLRVSAAAEGPDAVNSLLEFAQHLSALTQHADRAERRRAGVRRAGLRPALARRRRPRGRRGARVGHGRPGLELPDAPAYVVLLIDGLGQRLLERYAHAAPYLSSLVGHETGTAGVPSTTATSLTSLGTALLPGQHGLVGFTGRIPGTDRLINHLLWEKSVDPVEWQPHPTAFAGLAARRRARHRRQQARVLRLRADHRRATAARSTSAPTRSASGSRPRSSASAQSPSLTYVYDGDLDWTGHKFGVASAAWLQQLAMIDAEAEQLRESLPSSVRLLVVADHGMIDSPDEPASTSTRPTGSATAWR